MTDGFTPRRGEIRHLTGGGHGVTATTDAGEDVILYYFSDPECEFVSFSCRSYFNLLRGSVSLEASPFTVPLL